MKFNKCEIGPVIGLTVIGSLAFQAASAQENKELPNILWITSEDNSASFTGCYGNSFATTPNIDRLAAQGFLYTHAYCPSAVSAPARNCILTGVYAPSNGNENMRSYYRLSKNVHTYPEYLRQAGYYCTNNSKTDYNSVSLNPEEIWDESSPRAHYRNRPDGKPFFAVFNITISHESSIHKSIPTENLRHDPLKVILPPYHPDTPEMRHDWAQYYDKVEEMDVRVGELLKELEENGLAENTIVMYYGDNGGILARSKRYMYDTGTRIPFVVRIPEKYRELYPAENPGDKVDRLIDFADFAPTLLSISGIQVPGYMQGEAFLGSQKTADPQYVYMSRQRMDERYDLMRSVKDKKYRYIRNYMPFRISLQHNNYLFLAPSAQSWEKAFREGRTNEVQSRYFLPKPVEELYDTENDPWEINNLADDPAYRKLLLRMRKAEDDWMNEIRDVGLIPETEYDQFMGNGSMYDYMRSPDCPFSYLMKASGTALSGSAGNLKKYVRYLNSDNSAVRYWGATGLLILKEGALPAINELIIASNDRSGAVATLAAEALYQLGAKDAANKSYLMILQDTANYDMTDRTFALNSIDALDIQTPEIRSAAIKLYRDQTGRARTPQELSEFYDVRILEYMFSRWGVVISSPGND